MKKSKHKQLNVIAVDLAGLVFPVCNRPIYPITKKDKIELIRLFIRQRLTMQKQINYSIGSYGLKHIVERSLGFPISNGELITSMLHEGYAAQPFQYGSLNCRFNVYIPKHLI